MHLNGDNADTIQVAINDNGNTGSGGGTDIDLGSVNVDISAVNDDPTNVGSLPTDITVTEDVASNVDLSLIDIADVDSATGNLTVILTTGSGGRLAASTAGGVSVSGSSSGVLRLTGNQTDLNTFLNDVTKIKFTSDLNANGDNADTIQVAVTDNGNTGIGRRGTIPLGSVNVDIAPVNDDPTNAGSLPTDITVIEDVASNINLSRINLSDVDSASGDLTITLTTGSGGTLTAVDAGGVTVGGSGSGVLTLTGTQTELNAFLDTVTSIQFTSFLNANGDNADSIQISVTDNGNTGSGGGGTINFGSVNVDINAVNDDPTNAGSLPTDVTVERRFGERCRLKPDQSVRRGFGPRQSDDHVDHRSRAANWQRSRRRRNRCRQRQRRVEVDRQSNQLERVPGRGLQHPLHQRLEHQRGQCRYDSDQCERQRQLRFGRWRQHRLRHCQRRHRRGQR